MQDLLLAQRQGGADFQDADLSGTLADQPLPLGGATAGDPTMDVQREAT